MRRRLPPTSGSYRDTKERAKRAADVFAAVDFPIPPATARLPHGTEWRIDDLTQAALRAGTGNVAV